MAHTFVQKSQLLSQTGTSISHDHTPGSAATVAILAIFAEVQSPSRGGAITIDGTTPTELGTLMYGAEGQLEIWYVCKAFSGSLFTVVVGNTGGLTLNLEVVTANAGTGYTSAYHTYDQDQDIGTTADSCVLSVAPNAVGDFLYTAICSDENAETSVTLVAGTNWDANDTVVYNMDLGNVSSLSAYSIADATVGTEHPVTLRRRLHNVEVSNIPAGVRQTLLQDRYIEFTWAQVRDFIRNRMTNETVGTEP
jgi:hypothetical protein